MTRFDPLSMTFSVVVGAVDAVPMAVLQPQPPELSVEDCIDMGRCPSQYLADEQLHYFVVVAVTVASVFAVMRSISSTLETVPKVRIVGRARHRDIFGKVSRASTIDRVPTSER
ncbi:hypothetical protein B0T17DRAFT_530544 [Bombardia bombarda]|uniref:Uncharacterized protein n=1 Tax=Bombardia bombarda TaxID=252184 RepID=A0AA39WZN9_9PEZI|nr:hypothetical protein B0T17DRAFT_530544 [Bombardia bombarda]